MYAIQLSKVLWVKRWGGGCRWFEQKDCIRFMELPTKTFDLQSVLLFGSFASALVTVAIGWWRSRQDLPAQLRRQCARRLRCPHRLGRADDPLLMGAWRRRLPAPSPSANSLLEAARESGRLLLIRKTSKSPRDKVVRCIVRYTGAPWRVCRRGLRRAIGAGRSRAAEERLQRAIILSTRVMAESGSAIQRKGKGDRIF